MADKSLALVLELNGSMLASALDALERLSSSLDISFIVEHSPRPHITIHSCVDINNMSRLQTVITKNAADFFPLTIRGDGLGVFVRETPVVHIRWKICTMLLAFQGVVCRELSLKQDPNWLAKSTLAYKDLDYQKLGVALQLLQEFEFDTSMEVDRLSVYQVEKGQKERKLAEYLVKAGQWLEC